MTTRLKHVPLPVAEDPSPFSTRSILAEARSIVAAGVRMGLLSFPHSKPPATPQEVRRAILEQALGSLHD